LCWWLGSLPHKEAEKGTAQCRDVSHPTCASCRLRINKNFSNASPRAAYRRSQQTTYSTRGGLAYGGDIPIKKFFKYFHASGHRGEYRENPNETARKRATLAEVKARLNETPLNWMGAIELSYVCLRIMKMIEYLETLPRGTMHEALDLYEEIGEEIRLKVYTEMGHWPEEFPVPRGRMSGDESDDLFKLSDYQPPLF
jgi:hypothetical protein